MRNEVRTFIDHGDIHRLANFLRLLFCGVDDTASVGEFQHVGNSSAGVERMRYVVLELDHNIATLVHCVSEWLWEANSE
jgi:hypothetical protein